MARKSITFIAVAFITFFCVRTTHANDYITAAIAALQSEAVYVAPGIAGTDENTAVSLQRVLRPDDRIVLVLLPEEAASDESIEEMAQSLSAGLNDDRIIGLAVGRDVVGYAPLLPVGVASDQMNRADSVSNDSVTALITYARNMHLWLDANPQPTPVPTPVPTKVPTPTPLPGESSSPSLVGLLLIAFVSVLAVMLIAFVLTRRFSRKEGMDTQKSKDLDDASKALIAIDGYIQKVGDEAIRRVLRHIYHIARDEIVNEIKEEPHRATRVTVMRIKEDLDVLAEVLRLYTQILSGRLSASSERTGLKKNLENEFFPTVFKAFRSIADQLDRNDLKALEQLVRSLSNDFKTRGLQ